MVELSLGMIGVMTLWLGIMKIAEDSRLITKLSLASIMNGSADTTFYMLAVYYGSIGIKKIRHTVPACLLADFMGLLAAVFVTRMMFA